MSLNESRDDLVAKLGAELDPIRVTGDSRDVNPPCVVVGAPDALQRAGCGLSGECPVFVVASGPSNTDALNWLLDTVEAVAPLLEYSGEPWRRITFYPDPSGTAGLPAYETTTILTT